MKKTILSMIGLLAATAFAPQASAVPAFARQTGMGCNACHAQHFPVLNSFGRAFKADGFTMMGSQQLIEEEHLSLPATLNTGILLKAQYRMTNGDKKAYTNSAGDLVTTNGGKWMVPDEFGLFFGGRLTDSGTLKIGTMIEHDTSNLVGFRIPVVTDVGSVKLSAIPFLTDALGPFYGYTESSTGLNRAVRWNEHHADVSAHRFVGVATGAASGVTLMAKTDMGYINYSMWAPAFPMTDNSLSLNLIHVGFTPTIAGWDTVITAEVISGTSKAADPVTAFDFVDGEMYQATGFTAQAHGDLAGMTTGVYVTYANTPKSKATDCGAAAGPAVASDCNKYNHSSTDDTSAMTVGVDVSVIPHLLNVGAAMRNGSKGGLAENALSLNMNYHVAQNMGIQITHSMYSGDKYDAASYTAAGASNTGTSQTSFLLETAW